MLVTIEVGVGGECTPSEPYWDSPGLATGLDILCVWATEFRLPNCDDIEGLWPM
jgi:hypothetical protein